VAYRVERFRPRVEGGFARIERWTNTADASECSGIRSPARTSPADRPGRRGVSVGRSTGEGIPGILTDQAGASLHKRNLSPVPTSYSAATVRARFAPLETVAFTPNAAGRTQIMDLAGDGQPDVVMNGVTAGLFEHVEAQGWQPFRALGSRLNRDLSDPNLRLVDLDGDGRAEVSCVRRGRVRLARFAGGGRVLRPVLQLQRLTGVGLAVAEHRELRWRSISRLAAAQGADHNLIVVRRGDGPRPSAELGPRPFETVLRMAQADRLQ
jgi:hypothetical protein